MPGSGLEILRHTNIIMIISYLSPVGFLLFLLSINHYKKPKNVLVVGLYLFLGLFWMYGTVLRWQTPYQYYWMRYLLSEVLPYSLLFIALYIGYLYNEAKVPKSVVFLCVALISIYPLYFTARYFLNESTVKVGASSSLRRVSEYLNEDDLLILCREDGLGKELP